MRVEALMILIALLTVTGDFVEFVIVRVVEVEELLGIVELEEPLEVVDFEELPEVVTFEEALTIVEMVLFEESTSVNVLSLAFLILMEPDPTVKMTSKLLREAFEILPLLILITSSLEV